MTQNLQVFRQQTVFYLPIKIFTGLLVVFLKRRQIYFRKKYHKNINAYIIGLNKSFFINQFKNKIKFTYIQKSKECNFSN